MQVSKVKDQHGGRTLRYGKNGINNNTGIVDFNFEVFLEKETTSSRI